MTTMMETTVIPVQIKQYNDIKAKHPNALILFGCGNNYVAYNEDAKTIAKTLGLPLTKWLGVATTSFPYHALSDNLHRLVGKGHRVCVCDMLEKPKATVKRGITELVNKI